MFLYEKTELFHLILMLIYQLPMTLSSTLLLRKFGFLCAFSLGKTPLHIIRRNEQEHEQGHSSLIQQDNPKHRSMEK